jgi:hypothetical protein
MSAADQLLGGGGIPVRQRHREIDFEGKTAGVVRPDADRRRDGRVMDRPLLLTGQQFERAVKAGRVTGREQLLGVRFRAARAAQFLRNRELQVDHAVGGPDGPITASRGCDRRGIEYRHEKSPQ